MVHEYMYSAGASGCENALRLYFLSVLHLWLSAVCMHARSIDESQTAENNLCIRKLQIKQFCFDEPNQVFNISRCSNETVSQWLREYSQEGLKYSNWDADAKFRYYTDLNLNKYREGYERVSANVSRWRAIRRAEASRFPQSYYTEEIRRALKRITENDLLCDDNDIQAFAAVKSEMSRLYNSISVCLNDKCLAHSDFENLIASINSYDELQKLWVSYYDWAGCLREPYFRRLHLLNKGARENGYEDDGHYEWFTDSQDPDFPRKMRNLLEQIMPLYRELHAYVRYHLVRRYPDRFDKQGPIPIHLTANMWGQNWDRLLSRVKPYPNHPDVTDDVTAELKAQNYTVKRMFRLSEEFFESIGMYSMSPTFWNKTMMERPNEPNSTIDCHPRAWDFALGDDYRIQMCGNVTTDDLVTIHHEMGHIQYYMAYRDQPYWYRRGANSGFHEAIGDTIALSVFTPEHLKAVGLLRSNAPVTKEFDVNFLMGMALDKIPFFPFAFQTDLWRWMTFNLSIKPENANRMWWKMRLELAGLVPPVDRYSEKYFDPAAKYHVAINVPYIRYFMSFFLQFQFYKAICKEVGHRGPLHRCDFYNSTAAGRLLLNGMRLGSSGAWQDALYQITGDRDIKSEALLEYFAPLHQWLLEFNRKNNVPVGWTTSSDGHMLTPSAAYCFLIISCFLYSLLRS